MPMHIPSYKVLFQLFIFYYMPVYHQNYKKASQIESVFQAISNFNNNSKEKKKGDLTPLLGI